VQALLVIFAFALPARAQDETPKAELFAGYDYVRVNSTNTSSNFNCGSGQFTYNVNNWIGAAGDLGGYYTRNGFGAGIFSYLFGPRTNLRGHGKVTPFAQVLFGGPRCIVSSPQNVFAMTASGGVDYEIAEHFAIRPVQAEYFLTKFTDAASNRQNNFR
jgi:hypothetical protein